MRTILLTALAAAITTPALAREPTDCAAGTSTACHIRPGQERGYVLRPGKDEDWIKLDRFACGGTYVVIVKGKGQALPANIMTRNGQVYGTPQTSKLIVDSDALEVCGDVWVRTYSPIGMAGKYTVVYRRK